MNPQPVGTERRGVAPVRLGDHTTRCCAHKDYDAFLREVIR